MTGRVMSLIREAAPEYFRYSIDEAFCMLRGMEPATLKAWGEQLHKKIRKHTGMPVSIGIAPNKTLAKMASHFAKHYQGYRHCCVIDSNEKRTKALQLYPLDEVWGIGRRYAARLQAMGDKTAYDVAAHRKEWISATFNVVMMRTWAELNGDDCVPNETATTKKSICTSRSFAEMTDDRDTLATHIANFAARCAEKLRSQRSVASIIAVFIDTNRFREDLPQCWIFREKTLLTPTDSTQIIVTAAKECLDEGFRKGYRYKRAGVIVMGISPRNGIQTNFLDFDAERFQRLKRLDDVIDRINRTEGSETIVLGAQQYSRKGGKGKADVFANAIRHDFRSPCPTTRWSDIIILK